MISFGLSAEQRANRRNFVGGSESDDVNSGDPARMQRVYDRKGPDAPIEAETGTWTRLLQDRMEHASLDWIEEFGCLDPRGIRVIPPGPITRRGEQPTASLYPFIGCTLDGWPEVLKCPANVKRLSRWTGKKSGQTALEWAVEKYTVSTMHECLATDSLYGYLILVIDEAEPVAVRIDVDPWVAEEMVARLTAFWDCVVRREPPQAQPAFVAPKIEIAQLRRLDMLNPKDTLANNWSPDFIDLAHLFASTEGAHKKHMICREEIKKLLPDDVASVDYGRFHVSRTKANSITMKLDPEEKDE